MKKLLLMITLISLTLGLSGCQEETQDPQPDVDWSTLDYSEYLSDTNPVVTITVKDYGTIRLQLFYDVAPNTVNNFIYHIQNGTYTNNSFHRIVEDFVIQGGSSTSTCQIVAEVNNNPGYDGSNDLSHYRGVISMARTSVFDSATTQFFLMHVDYPYLDGNYAAFGGMVSGFDVLDAIATADAYNQAPLDEIVIESITVDTKGIDYSDPVCD